MNDRKTNNKLLESLLLIIGMTILGVLSGGFATYILLFPAIYTVFTIKNGNNAGLISIIITAVLVGLIGSIEIAIFLLVITLPSTYIFSTLIRERRKSSEVMIINTVLFFLLFLLMFKVMELGGISFVEALEDGFSSAISSQLDIYKGMGLTSLEMNERKDFLESSYKYAMLVLPSIMIILSLVISYLNYVIIVIGLEKLELRLANRPQLARFRLPSNLMFVIGILLIVSLFIGNLESPFILTSFLNIQVLIGFAFTIQGLSVIEHILVKRRIRLWIRTMSYFLFIFVTPMISLLPVVGIADMVFDFKKIKRPKP